MKKYVTSSVFTPAWKRMTAGNMHARNVVETIPTMIAKKRLTTSFPDVSIHPLKRNFALSQSHGSVRNLCMKLAHVDMELRKRASKIFAMFNAKHSALEKSEVVVDTRAQINAERIATRANVCCVTRCANYN